jgi:hypothetical protein
MKITAQGRNRTVYTHSIVDSEIKSVETDSGKLKFRLNSKDNPGIGSGQFILYFEIEKSEVEKLFEASMRITTDAKILALEDELRELKFQLAQLAL